MRRKTKTKNEKENLKEKKNLPTIEEIKRKNKELIKLEERFEKKFKIKRKKRNKN